MIEVNFKHYYEYQVTTEDHHQEPVKSTKILETPWGVVTVDLGRPYPDGHHNSVAIDKRMRYHDDDIISSTSIEPTKQTLNNMCATHGTP
jgi:hypothetical protein